MPSVADDRQVGGKHYKSSYEHWNYALNVELGYLEAASTKYVVRHRSKNGGEDLEKAGHYLQKLIEHSRANGVRIFERSHAVRSKIVVEARHFAMANSLTSLESCYVYLLSSWTTVEELVLASDVLEALVAIYKTTSVCARPVPLTEENHYADRVAAKDYSGNNYWERDLSEGGVGGSES